MRSLLPILMLILILVPLHSRGLFDSDERETGEEDFTGYQDSTPQSTKEATRMRSLISLPPEGVVESFAVRESTLYLNSGSSGAMDMPWPFKGNQGVSLLERVDSYRYSERRRPDGAIRNLALYSGDEMLAWVGSGLRNGGILDGILSVEDDGGILLIRSSDRSWTLEPDKGVAVDWGEGIYTAWLSRVVRGVHIDNPDLSFNLILLKN